MVQGRGAEEGSPGWRGCDEKPFLLGLLPPHLKSTPRLGEGDSWVSGPPGLPLLRPKGAKNVHLVRMGKMKGFGFIKWQLERDFRGDVVPKPS